MKIFERLNLKLTILKKGGIRTKLLLFDALSNRESMNSFPFLSHFVYNDLRQCIKKIGFSHF